MVENAFCLLNLLMLKERNTLLVPNLLLDRAIIVSQDDRQIECQQCQSDHQVIHLRGTSFGMASYQYTEQTANHSHQEQIDKWQTQQSKLPPKQIHIGAHEGDGYHDVHHVGYECE